MVFRTRSLKRLGLSPVSSTVRGRAGNHASEVATAVSVSSARLNPIAPTGVTRARIVPARVARTGVTPTGVAYGRSEGRALLPSSEQPPTLLLGGLLGGVSRFAPEHVAHLLEIVAGLCASWLSFAIRGRAGLGLAGGGGGRRAVNLLRVRGRRRKAGQGASNPHYRDLARGLP